MEALANAMVVIISQYINVSNQHNFTQYLHNIICQSCLNKLVKKIRAIGIRQVTKLCAMSYLSIKLRLITAPASWVITKLERIRPVLGTLSHWKRLWCWEGFSAWVTWCLSRRLLRDHLSLSDRTVESVGHFCAFICKERSLGEKGRLSVSRWLSVPPFYGR